MSQYVEVHYDQVLKETGNAVLIRIDDEEWWLPWSQIENNGELKEHDGVLYLRQWLADEKEIPYQ